MGALDSNVYSPTTRGADATVADGDDTSSGGRQHSSAKE
jgi:hypothetical protein